MPATDSKQESRREVAERIVRRQIIEVRYGCEASDMETIEPQRTIILASLTDAIEAALEARDERGARICEDLVTFTEDHGGQEPCKWCEALEKAAAAIRNGDTNAK